VSATKLDLAAEALDAAMRDLHRLFRGTRLAELRGEYVKKFDAQGLHPASVAVGRVLALRELFPELADVEFELVAARFKAEVDAHDAFAQELWGKVQPSVRSED
jgi:hypothetical protein